MFWPKRFSPHEVFTPRAPIVNDDMYIGRPHLERGIHRAFQSGLNLIIHGESGSGKTWLYKKALTALEIPFYALNMANAHRFQSLDKALTEFVNSMIEERKTTRSTEYTAEVDAKFASSGTTRTSEFEQVEAEPFLRCLRHIHVPGKKTLLVFDNFERVLDDQKLLKETVDVITLLDDESYARYNVKIAIVGVPNDIRRYFSAIDTSSTVANRIKEVPEVARLTSAQTRELITRGFEKLHLPFEEQEKEEIIRQIGWLTDRIPQQLHELCLEIALEVEGSSVIDKVALQKASDLWAASSLLSNYTVITDLMNSRDTRIGRRNQTLYILGKMDGEDFRPSDVEQALRAEFPDDTIGVTLNISQVLSELARGPNPLVRRTPRGDEYRFVSPKYRMCLRTVLRRTDQGTVEKVDMRNI